MMPPLMTVGSRCAASSTQAIRLVVVVLPCVPPTATAHFSRISSASISARRTTGISRARAATTSGLSRFTAVETTTTCAAPEIGRVMADGHRNARLAQPQHVGGLGDVAALHGVSQRVQHLGDAGHADAADADEVDGADGKRQCPHRRSPARSAMRASTRSARPAGRVGTAHGVQRAAAAAAPAPPDRPAARQPFGQRRRGEPRLRHHPGATGLGQSAGVGGLMIVDRTRQRHQDRRPPGDREFRDGGRAGPGDHQMRRRQACRDIGKERRQLSR